MVGDKFTSWSVFLDLTTNRFNNLTSRLCHSFINDTSYSTFTPLMLLPGGFQKLINAKSGMQVDLQKLRGESDEPGYLKKLILFGFYPEAKKCLTDLVINRKVRSDNSVMELFQNQLLFIEGAEIKASDIYQTRNLDYNSLSSLLLHLSQLTSVPRDFEDAYRLTNSLIERSSKISLSEKLVLNLRLVRYHLRYLGIIRSDHYDDELDKFVANYRYYDQTSSILLLIKEIYKRVLTTDIYFNILKNGTEDYKHENLILEIDPYSSKNLLLLGLKHRKSDISKSINYFEKARSLGFIEERFCNYCLKNTDQLLSDEASVVKAPFSLESLNQQIEIQLAKPCKNELHIKRSNTFKKHSQYWTLNSDGDSRKANYTLNLQLALQNYASPTLPYFNTVFVQHCYPDNLRKQIVYSANNDNMGWDSRRIYGSTIFDLQHESELLFEIANKLDDTLTSKNYLREAYYLRILSYLGFNDLAIKYYETNCLSEDNTDPDKAHLDYSYLFALNLNGYHEELETVSENLFNKYSIVPGYSEFYLRTLLSITITAGVYWAKVKFNKVQVEKWVQRGQIVMDQINRSSDFSKNEKDLLLSRFYRFRSFVYLFNSETKNLLKAAIQFYDIAKQLLLQADCLIFRDNFFAASESLSRAYRFAGINNMSVGLINDSIEKADPFDPRLHMQLAEYYLGENETKLAIEAYRRVIELGPPYEMIANYRIGCLCKQLGDYENAILHFMNSTYNYPTATEPHFEIIKLTSDRYIKDKSLYVLNQLNISFNLDALTKDRIKNFNDGKYNMEELV